jgi:hypothetical protein
MRGSSSARASGTGRREAPGPAVFGNGLQVRSLQDVLRALRVGKVAPADTRLQVLDVQQRPTELVYVAIEPGTSGQWSVRLSHVPV